MTFKVKNQKKTNGHVFLGLFTWNHPETTGAQRGLPPQQLQHQSQDNPRQQYWQYPISHPTDFLKLSKTPVDHTRVYQQPRSKSNSVQGKAEADQVLLQGPHKLMAWNSPSSGRVNIYTLLPRLLCCKAQPML